MSSYAFAFVAITEFNKLHPEYRQIEEPTNPPTEPDNNGNNHNLEDKPKDRWHVPHTALHCAASRPLHQTSLSQRL